jgi:hypothetical protein
MKKIYLPVLICTFSFLLASFADMCDGLHMFKEGTTATMTNYNEDGKVTGSNKTVYTGVTKNADGVTVTANSETFDKKGKSDAKGTYTMKCKGGNLYLDMRMMIPAEQTSSIKDMKMKIETSDLEFPAELTVGSTLKDAYINMTSEAPEGGMAIPFKLNMRMYNRKVEAKENVTTPAGTFECYKISTDFESRMMVKINGKTISWFSPEAGTVKSETYNSKGKMQGYSLLTELKK